MSYLLDTHVLLKWVWQDPSLAEQHKQITSALTPEDPALVSSISLWEIATLYSLSRITLDVPLRDFLERATAPPLVRRVDITTAIAAEVAALPDSFHRDPGDRVIVASARVLGATLLTQDDKIIEAGIVKTL